MGLFGKLKNALFEEEEIEVSASPNKVVINDDSVEKKKEVVTSKQEEKEETERDLFKAENTFKFPDFDEEEFVSSYKPSIEKEMDVEEAKKEPEPIIVHKTEYSQKKAFENVSPTGYDYERKAKPTRKEPVKKEKSVATKEKETTPSGFRPSPVISPVYGVLDKNYKKEDIVTVEKPSKVKPKMDVDMVRRKAFGTLEDDIENTFNDQPVEKFYKREKSVDDYLKESADDAIDVTYEKRSNSLQRSNSTPKRSATTRVERELEEEDFEVNLEEEFKKEKESLQPLDESRNVENVENNENYLEENTLESDLFDLIDSMYDNREEE